MLPGGGIGKRAHHTGSVALIATPGAWSLGAASFTTGGEIFAWGSQRSEAPAWKRFRLTQDGIALSIAVRRVPPLHAAGIGYRKG